MNNQQLLKELDKTVYGHEQAKKVLINLAQRANIRHYRRWGLDQEVTLQPLKCLLVGDSGCGKTHLVTELAKLMDLIFIYVDATSLAPTGAGDGIKSDSLKKIVEKTVKSKVGTHPFNSFEGALDRTIIFVDEIDKLAVAADSTGRWNDHVQANFLTLIDNKEQFAGLSWIFAGAFSSRLEKINDPIGFFAEKGEGNDFSIDKTGLIPELIGRINQLVLLDRFNKEDYVNILKTKVLPNRYNDLIEMGIEFTPLSKKELERLAEIALKSNNGVRSLERELNTIFTDIEFEMSCTP